MISSISSFEIINVATPDSNTFLRIPASAADSATPNGIKRLLANDISTVVVKGNPLFSNGDKSWFVPPDCRILESFL